MNTSRCSSAYGSAQLLRKGLYALADNDLIRSAVERVALVRRGRRFELLGIACSSLCAALRRMQTVTAHDRDDDRDL